MKVLVTGAAGFIGSFVTRALISRGDDVVGIDNFDPYYSILAKKWNIGLINLHANKNPKYFKKDSLREVYHKITDSVPYKKIGKVGTFNFEIGDIRDIKFLKKTFKKHKFDAVIHLAALAGVPKSIEDPVSYAQVNVEGTINLLECSKDAKLKKFVFGSSSSVYGERSKVPFKESEDIVKPISPYAATKVAGEIICFTYHYLFDLKIAVIRIFGPVFGPLQRPYGMFLQRAIKFSDNNIPIPIYGKAGWKMKRDYTYIDDEVQGLISAVDKKFNFEIINIGSGVPRSLREQLNIVEKVMGRKAKIKYLPEKKTEVSITYADISKAKKILSYQPKTHFLSGVRKQYEVYRLMPSWYREV